MKVIDSIMYLMTNRFPVMKQHWHPLSPFQSQSSTAAAAAATAAALANNKEKIKQWIREQAIKFCATYLGAGACGPGSNGSSSHPALSILNRLCDATQMLAASALSQVRGTTIWFKHVYLQTSKKLIQMDTSKRLKNTQWSKIYEDTWGALKLYYNAQELDLSVGVVLKSA